MARPRKDAPPDRFTSTELAVAAGISARSFGVLIESGLAPEAVDEAAGKRSTRYWDSFGIGEAALIGAIHKSGAELLMSAKVAHLVIDEFVSPRGHLPSRLGDYLDRPLNPTPGQFPWKSEDRKIDLRIDDDFWLHHLLKTRSTIYQPGTAMEGDMVLEIVDRRYVFTDFAFSERRKLPVMTPWGLRPSSEPEMSLEIDGWERGKDAVVRPLYDIIDFGGMMDNPAKQDAAKALEQEWLNARRNAVGLLRVNVSLAIRNAFDAVHEHRLMTGASFDWTATGKPKPGRYAGCFPDGTPVDPDHPWNRDLPPDERAKRLAEIEEYVAAREAAEANDSEGEADTS